MGLPNYHKKCIYRGSIDCILTNKHIVLAHTQQTTIIGVNARILLDMIWNSRNNNLKNFNLSQTLNSCTYTHSSLEHTNTCS